MVCEVFDGVLASLHLNIGAFTEGCNEMFGFIHFVSPDQLGNLLIAFHSQGTEENHERNIFTEAGNTDGKRISKSIELGRETNLKLLGRHCEGFMKGLEFDGMGVLGGCLFVEEYHDAIISHLLLAENGTLRSMDDEVSERILRAFTHLFERHGIILEDAERGTKHHGNFTE